MSELKFGTDPEIFAVYSTPEIQSDNYIPAPFALSPAVLERQHGLKSIGGDDKHPIYIENDEFRIIGDGVAFEINLRKPYTKPEGMHSAVKNALDATANLISKFGLALYTKPVVNFEASRFWTKEAMNDMRLYWGTIFGCDPDKDAFNVEWTATISNQEEHVQRYGGGHLHFSGSDLFGMYPLPAVKLFALYVGNYVTWKTPNKDLEILRAKYYGKPGKYRVQNYSDGSVGIEYRTPSNSWLDFALEDYMRIFDMARQAVESLENPRKGISELKFYSEDTIRAISTADSELAGSILTSLGAI